jgi:hypothetical protein
MRAFRSLLPIFLLLFLLLTSTVSRTQSATKTQARVDTPVLKKSKVKITDIDPGTLKDGDQVTLQITGKHLNLVNFIQLRAKSATAAGNASSLISVSNADETTTSIQHINDTQLLVYLDLTKIQPADSYLLSLGLGKDSTDPQITVTYPFPINVYDPAASTTSKASPAPSSSSGQSPFASCLTSSPSLVQPSTSQAATGVNCSISTMTDKEVADNFGQHVSTVYYALQLRVSNQNTQYDFLLRDILITLPNGSVVSGRIKRLAQGVAVKGKSEDRRAYWYNGMQAAGTVYGAAVTLPLSATFKNIGNLFQGPLEAAFGQVWPDYSVDNVTRFNNAVFDDQNPSIVPKGGIAQPPLYVVALLPKPDGKSAYKSSYINMVTVGIEGTFIKQVNTIALSPGTLTFQPEFISPPSLSQVLGSDVNIDELEATSTAQSITLNNQSSSPINITKVDITSGSSGSSSLDFHVASDQGTCGTQKIDANKAFSVPAQQSCQIFIRSTPQNPGATTASLTLEGTNLDTTQVVTLTGSGVGFYLDTASVGGKKTPFQCSLIAGAGKCTVDLGFVSVPTTGSTTVSINSYIFAASATDTTTCPSDTVKLGDAAAVSLCDSNKPLVLPLTTEETAHKLNLTLVSAATPVTGTFTFGQQTEAITFDYQTIQTTAVITTANNVPAGTSVTVIATTTATATTGSTPLVGKKVQLSITEGTTALTPLEATTDSTGKATFNNALPTASTKYTLTAIVEENGAYAQSDQSAAITVTTAAAPTPAGGTAPTPSPTTPPAAGATSHTHQGH